MAIFTGLPRPRRTFWELLAGARVAPVSARWHAVAALRKHCPTLLAPPVRRIYQLDYLAQDKLAQFTADCAAGKPGAGRWLNELAYGQDQLGLTVASELVSVYLLQSADYRSWVVLLPAAAALPAILPVTGRLLLCALFARSKQVLLVE